MHYPGAVLLFILLISSTVSSFQFSLFKQLSSYKSNENTIISPISVYQALSLLTNGASGNTQKELLSTLGAYDTICANSINFNFLAITSKNRNLHIAKAVLSTFTPNDSFIQVAKKYHALASKLLSVDQVNKWCSDNTNNKITSIINDISNVELILGNAVYFKSTWKYKFSEKITHKQYFHIDKNNKKLVDTMELTLSKVNYFDDTFAQVIEGEYTDKEIVFDVILPKEGVELTTFISNGSSEAFDSMLQSGRPRKVNGNLPKFQLECQTELKGALKKMGINDAFIQGKANFDNISSHGNLAVDRIVQKTYVNVDEEGTEAAAVTAVVMANSISPRDEMIIMNVDRPFMFAIRHKDLDCLGFLGKVIDVEKSN